MVGKSKPSKPAGPRKPAGKRKAVHPKHPVRRAIWNTFARVGATGMHSLPLSKRWIDFHRRPMPLRNLDPALVGKRIVQISDIHYSPVVWRRYLQQYFDFINEIEPDLIVVTGDLITGGYRYARRVAHLLKQLDAPMGVVCTFGNHDYSMWGKKYPRQATRRGDHLEEAIEAEGVIVLRNEVLRFGAPGKELVIVGLDDEWTGKMNPDLAFDGVGADEAVVCLNHNPVNALELLKYPWQWMLSGHTHGRQVGHKGWSKALLAKRLRPFVHGYYDVGGRHLYVNRGLSYGQRIHAWCRPEVTVFRLTAAD
jgi:predicted MPP superfamily phosphohydrolase